MAGAESRVPWQEVGCGGKAWSGRSDGAIRLALEAARSGDNEVFRGTYQHAIDPKGRSSLPAKFRELVSAEGAELVVLTQGPDKALWAYAPAAWDALMKRLEEKSPFDQKVSMFKHAFVAPAQDCPFDKLGRVLVPPMLRDYAGLESDVVWAGLIDHVELWSLSNWKKRQEEAVAMLAGDPFAAGGAL